jgi:hypothetical protein
MGYGEVVAVVREPGPLWRDIFRAGAILEAWGGVPIRQVKPDVDPKDLGVDFAAATEEGLAEVYRLGKEESRRFSAARAPAEGPGARVSEPGHPGPGPLLVR